jgi:hypothetical protein
MEKQTLWLLEQVKALCSLSIAFSLLSVLFYLGQNERAVYFVFVLSSSGK